MSHVNQECRDQRKLYAQRRLKHPSEIIFTEEEWFYFHNHVNVLTRPSLAERLNITLDQLDYFIRQRRNDLCWRYGA